MHAIAGGLDDDNLGMVKEPVQHSGGDGAVVVKNGGPLSERLVGRQDDGTTFIAMADNLVEQIGASLVDDQ